MPYHDISFNDPEDIDDAGDVNLPAHKHHMTIKAELDRLAEEGVISDEEASDLYEEWQG